ncbi:MAG: hypothetical protein EF813_07860 [Methanosarcinales archaeon]|nr:MAG: hypothetical protein EF813_07860 [Methanosarcinales archaeon]
MENHSKKSSDADFRYQLKDRIDRLESHEDVFDLFRYLDYPPSYILNPTFKRDLTGFNSAKPIRKQGLDPLPDRKTLDDVVFDAIGLTDDVRKEVYWAVTELLKHSG